VNASTYVPVCESEKTPDGRKVTYYCFPAIDCADPRGDL